MKDVIGYLLFLLFFVLIMPLLFISGGIARIIRYYRYVSDSVHNREPKHYPY